MEIKIISSYGWDEAFLGLSLSYNQPIEKMPSVAKKLMANSSLSSGELKFLEYISVYLDITAPLYFWNHFDTYRIGNKEIWRDGVKQSESKMHTILKNELTQENFESPIYDCTLENLNNSIKEKKFIEVINNLPDGFLQRRIYKTDIKTLMYICSQRNKHKLEVWKTFTNAIAEFLEKEFKENLDGFDAKN